MINCHLAAGQNAVRRRNADAAGLLEEKAVFASTEHPLAYVGGGDGTMVLDHEIVIVSRNRSTPIVDFTNLSPVPRRLELSH